MLDFTATAKEPHRHMDNCCIHVGLPKTATTMLQTHLFPHHPQIEYLGKFSRRRNMFRDAAVRTIIMELLRGRVFNPDVKRCRRLFVDSVAPALQAGRVPLLSSEDLSVGGPRRRRARAQNLRAVFGDCKVMITLRHPARFVESMYLHKLKEIHFGRHRRFGAAPRYLEIDEWISNEWRRPEKGALAHLQYASTIEILRNVFGEESVGVFLFEQLVEDAGKFVESLCRFIGIDPAEGVRLAAGRRENDRLTTAQIDGIKTTAKSLLRSTLFRFSPRTLRQRMLGRRVTAKDPAAPAARARIPAQWQERFAELTREGNRRLMERGNLPLDRYGYPC